MLDLLPHVSRSCTLAMCVSSRPLVLGLCKKCAVTVCPMGHDGLVQSWVHMLPSSNPLTTNPSTISSLAAGAKHTSASPSSAASASCRSCRSSAVPGRSDSCLCDRTWSCAVPGRLCTWSSLYLVVCSTWSKHALVSVSVPLVLACATMGSLSCPLPGLCSLS